MIADDEEAAAGTITARPLGADEVRTAYDRLGRKAASADPRGMARTCSYDTAGRLASDAGEKRCQEPFSGGGGARKRFLTPFSGAWLP